MKKKWIYTFVLVLLISCNSDENAIMLEGSTFLVFGHFYGECLGEACVETFKLTETQLFEDTLDEYSGANQQFEVLPNGLFAQVQDLIDFFPSRLLSEEETFIGCPDCADGGGIFIQFSENDELKTWRIDQDKGNVPDYLHEFIDKINEKIAIINN